jgi:O-Antigen ligase
MGIPAELETTSRCRRAVWFALALVTLSTASDMKFRLRDPTAALQGAIDAQVAFELGVWLVMALWGLAIMTAGGRRIADADLRSDIGPALRVFVVVALVSVMSCVYAPTPTLAAVRGGQLVVLASLLVWTYRQLRVSSERLRVFWLTTRRTVWAIAIIASALNLLLPLQDPTLSTPTPGEPARFHWFAVHPIATAGMLGLAVILLTGTLFGLDDRLFRRATGKVVRIVLLCGLWTLLLATRSRGSIFATLGGTAVLITLAPSRRRRAVAVLVTVTIVAGLLFATTVARSASETATTFILRGQSDTDFRSLSGRQELFDLAWRLFLERPVLGYGYGAGRSVFLERIPWAGESHNVVVEIGISLGLVGLALYVLLFTRVIRQLAFSIRRLGTGVEALCAREAAALCAFLLVTGTVEEGFVSVGSHQSIALGWTVLLADLAWRAHARRHLLASGPSGAGADVVPDPAAAGTVASGRSPGKAPPARG